MRKVLLLLLLAGLALPGHAAKRVTVQQLEQLVAAIHDKPDADVASKLSQLELIEQLDPVRTERLRKSLPGTRTQDALLALADASVFVGLPASEIPTLPAPDADAQRQLLDSAGLYAAQTLSKLPNFFATRETTLFMDSPPIPGRMTVPAEQSMQFAEEFSATVFYRNGKQIAETVNRKGKISDVAPKGLVTSGEFGPILGTLLADAHRGELVWSHWERGAAGQRAVFRYSVPKEESHYKAEFCCVSMNGGRGVFKRLSGYHGEITIDPETGTILRLTMQADLKPPYPMTRADLMVEYGPVEIGGKTYICPMKSVAIARGYEPAKPIGMKGKPDDWGGLLVLEDEADGVSDGPEILQTMLNHVVFRQYHLFRSETRILSGDDEDPKANPPAPVPSSAAPATPPAVPPQ